MKMVEIKFYQGLNNYEICSEIRKTVFMLEQGFLVDYDIVDDTCTHCVLFVDNIAAGCARFYLDENNHYHLGRFAILKQYRKCGYGKVIIEAIENEIVKLNHHEILLSAQVNAVKFYEKSGFKVVSDVYLDEHCEHVDMIKSF